MALDRVLEKEVKKFDIDTEIKMNIEKYLSPDDKWDIVTKFFKNKMTDANVWSVFSDLIASLGKILLFMVL